MEADLEGKAFRGKPGETAPVLTNAMIQFPLGPTMTYTQRPSRTQPVTCFCPFDRLCVMVHLLGVRHFASNTLSSSKPSCMIPGGSVVSVFASLTPVLELSFYTHVSSFLPTSQTSIQSSTSSYFMSPNWINKVNTQRQIPLSVLAIPSIQFPPDL